MSNVKQKYIKNNKGDIISPMISIDSIYTNTGESIGKVAGYNASDLVNSSGASTDVKRSARMWGNVGVTTTQQMIEEERRVSEFNISDYIIESFKLRFCLLIY